jgi:hypothetical protein
VTRCCSFRRGRSSCRWNINTLSDVRLVSIDESARDDDYYFFGALIADPAAVRSVEAGLDGVALMLSQQVDGFDPATEFHAVDMFHGNGAWNTVPLGLRVKACTLVAKVLERSSAAFIFRGVDLCALRQRYGARAFAPHLLTLAQLLEAVDERLRWLDEPDGLGLVLADEHHTASSARRSLRSFKSDRVRGLTKRPLGAIADTIYFGPSHESRLLQATDVATFFFNRELTVDERDQRSAAAVREITGRIRVITAAEYVWSPVRKTQRPAGRRGVG